MKNLVGVALIGTMLGLTVIGINSINDDARFAPNVVIIKKSQKKDKVVKVKYKPKEVKKVDKLAIV